MTLEQKILAGVAISTAAICIFLFIKHPYIMTFLSLFSR